MEEKLQQFNNFDFSDERWQTYLADLYPQPNYKQTLKFKKKWYKKNIDPEFDVSYEPGIQYGSSGGGAGTGNATGAQCGDGAEWASMGFKATLCFIMYAGCLTLSIAALFGLVDTRYAIGMLAGSFINELLLKHPIKFSTEYLRSLFSEDLAIVPFMAIAVLIPGIHNTIVAMALGPCLITCILSLSLICKHHPSLPGFIKRPLAPLAEVHTRYMFMQGRANVEVMVGFILLVGIFMKLTTIAGPLLYWNTLRIRYTTSPWTQATFRKIDEVLNPVLGKIPGISSMYAKLKDVLHRFMDAKQGSGCNIL